MIIYIYIVRAFAPYGGEIFLYSESEISRFSHRANKRYLTVREMYYRDATLDRLTFAIYTTLSSCKDCHVNVILKNLPLCIVIIFNWTCSVVDQRLSNLNLTNVTLEFRGNWHQFSHVYSQCATLTMPIINFLQTINYTAKSTTT